MDIALPLPVPLALEPESLRALGEAFDSAWRSVKPTLSISADAHRHARNSIAESLLDAAKAGDVVSHDVLVRQAVVRASMPPVALG